jgi:hypothetical protein
MFIVAIKIVFINGVNVIGFEIESWGFISSGKLSLSSR